MTTGAGSPWWSRPVLVQRPASVCRGMLEPALQPVERQQGVCGDPVGGVAVILPMRAGIRSLIVVFLVYLGLEMNGGNRAVDAARRRGAGSGAAGLPADQASGRKRTSASSRVLALSACTRLGPWRLRIRRSPDPSGWLSSRPHIYRSSSLLFQRRPMRARKRIRVRSSSSVHGGRAGTSRMVGSSSMGVPFRYQGRARLPAGSGACRGAMSAGLA